MAWVEPNENDAIEPVDSTLMAIEDIQEEEPETFELYPVEGSLEKAEEMLQTLATTTGIEDLYIGQVERAKPSLLPEALGYYSKQCVKD